MTNGAVLITRFVYENGRLVRSETRREGSMVRTSRRTYEHDERGFVVQEIGETERGRGGTRYRRDEHGNVLQTATWENDGPETITPHVLELDAAGRVTRDETSRPALYLDGRDPGDERRSSWWTYTRDEDGRPMLSVETNDLGTVRSCETTYDEHGTLVREECRWQRSGDVQLTRYEASYDACGNLAVRSELGSAGEERQRWEHRYECTPEVWLDW